jgi:hypothetical protein
LSRRIALTVAVVIGGIAAGGLVGTGARWWIGGLNGQRDQLHQCVLTSRQAHPTEGAAAVMADLRDEVPGCMNKAGYETALDNKQCVRDLWQGDVYCYLPNSRIGRMLYKLMTLI